MSSRPPTTSIYRTDLLQDQVALVTGGGSGLGRAIAEAYRDHGAQVAIASRKTAEAAAADMGVKGYTLDVRDADACKAVVEQVEADLGPITQVVNNAAGNFLVPFEELSENGWRAVLGIVLDGTANVTRAVAPGMLERGRGHVLNILATYAWSASPYVSHSGAAKAGVMNLTRSLAVEWGPRGVRCNAIAPGPIVTKNASENLGYASPEIQERIKTRIPARRLGTPEEVSDAALYLASDAASWVTGEVLVIDGGQWLVGDLFSGVVEGA